MKIVHVNLARGFRGGERQTLNLMTGLQRIGVKQSLICCTGEELGRRAESAGFEIQAIDHFVLGHGSASGGDVIHAHEARGIYWAALEKLLRATPYIVTRRILNPISNSLGNAWAYKGAALLVGVSDAVAAGLTAQTNRTVTTILDCVTELHVDPESVRAIRDNLGGSPVIGHVGTLDDATKGQLLLLQAFSLLTRDFPDARLVLVGSGEDRQRFVEQAAGDNRIVFAGQQENVGPWIASMDVFAFPSREEGLGSSVLDAMSLGVPVVTSAAGGLPEIVANGQRGILLAERDPAAWAEALHTILVDGDLRAKLIANAGAFANANNADAMARRYLACYEKVMATARTT